MIERIPTKIRQLIFLGISLLSLLLLAGGLGALNFKPGQDFNLFQYLLGQIEREPLFPASGDPISWGPWNNDLQTMLVIVFWIILVFSILFIIISPEFRRDLVRIFTMVLTLVFVMPYILEQFSRIEPQEVTMEEAAGGLMLDGKPIPAPPAFIQNPPAWFLVLAKVLLLGLVLAGIYALWRFLRPKPDAQAVIVHRARHALSELDSGLAFKDVVIACYAQMCRELQETQGIDRPRALTPREFERYLADAGIASEHISQLTLLFEGARYSDQPSDPVGERQAVQSLKAITEAYGD